MTLFIIQFFAPGASFFPPQIKLEINQSLTHCSIDVHRPGSLNSMKKLEDMSEARVDKFGQHFLDIIIPFATEHEIKLDDFPEVNLGKVSEGMGWGEKLGTISTTSRLLADRKSN